MYLGWAVVLFSFPVAQANWVGAALVLAASVLAFAGLGVLSASYALLFKRGNPVKWLFLGVAGLVSGIMYPVTVLPAALQAVARLVPVTYSLEGMRAALLQHASISSLWPSLRALLLVRAGATAGVARGVFLGAAANQGYGHTHPLLAACKELGARTSKTRAPRSTLRGAPYLIAGVNHRRVNRRLIFWPGQAPGPAADCSRAALPAGD